MPLEPRGKREGKPEPGTKAQGNEGNTLVIPSLTIFTHPVLVFTRVTWLIMGILIVVTVIIAGIALWFFIRGSRATLRLPPGPRPTLFLGNLLDMPKGKEWITYSEWVKQYGDIVYLNVLGKSLLVVGSAEVASDLMVKRGATYSDRAPSYMAADLVGFRKLPTLLQLGPRFRRTRQFYHNILNARAVQQFIPLHIAGFTRCMQRLLTSPEDFVHHIEWTAGFIMLKLTYDHEISEHDDPLFAAGRATIEIFSQATRPGWMVEFVPSLQYLPKWFPGAGFLRTAEKWRKEVLEGVTTPFNAVKRKMAEGSACSCFTSKLLEGEGGEPLSAEDEDIVMWAAAALCEGGLDTTVSSQIYFLLAMTLYPDIQRRAQQEIDALTKHERLPAISDRPNLPFIEALLKETYRWGPIVPSNAVHATSKADNYAGYDIPEGTLILPNIWNMLHDPRWYPQPMEFDPDRFLRPSTPGVNDDPGKLIFGFGRRECPGRHFADTMTWVFMVMTLATFNVSKARDAQGREIEPVVDYISGTIVRPAPFECRIEPRSAAARALISH